MTDLFRRLFELVAYRMSAEVFPDGPDRSLVVITIPGSESLHLRYGFGVEVIEGLK